MASNKSRTEALDNSASTDSTVKTSDPDTPQDLPGDNIASDASPAAPTLVSVTNISGMSLTIQSQGSKVFPSGETKDVSPAEAQLWADKKWVVIND